MPEHQHLGKVSLNVKAEHPLMDYATRHPGAATLARGAHIPVSDRLHLWITVGIAVIAAGALVLAALAFSKVETEDKTFDQVHVTRGLKVGTDGRPITYLASGTMVIAPGVGDALPTSTPVSIPAAPHAPQVFLSINQGGAPVYTGATVSATDVTATSFTILADTASAGTATVAAGTPAFPIIGSLGTEGTVDLGALEMTVTPNRGEVAITTPFKVSWLAIA